MSRSVAPRNPRLAPTLWPVLAAAAALALVAPTARGMFGVLPREVPVDRLV